MMLLVLLPLLSVLVHLLHLWLLLWRRIHLLVTLNVVNWLVLSLFDDLYRGLEEHTGAHRISSCRIVIDRVTRWQRVLLVGLLKLVLVQYYVMNVALLLLHRSHKLLLVNQWIDRLALHGHLGLFSSLSLRLVFSRSFALDTQIVKRRRSLRHVIVWDLMVAPSLLWGEFLFFIKHVHTSDVVFGVCLTTLFDRYVPSLEPARSLSMILYRSLNILIDSLYLHLAHMMAISDIVAFL